MSDSSKLREDDVLSIALLYECFGRPSEAPSKWATHIEMLPTGRLLNAINLSPTALEHLEGSALHILACRQQEQVISDFEELSASPLMVGDTYLSSCEWWSSKNYRWALAQIHSRFVSVATEPGEPPRKAMAPFFDLFNHSSATPSAISHSFVAGNRAVGSKNVAASADDENEGSLVVVARRSLVEGEEACLNYGPLGNLRLLQLYGFVLPDNHFDALDIWARMDPTAPEFSVKDRALARLALRSPFALTRQPPVLSPSLLAAIRIQCAKGSEMACLENALKGPLSEANERETLAALEMALTIMREALPVAREEKEWGEEELQERGGEENVEAQLVRTYLESERALLTQGLEAVAVLQRQKAYSSGMEY
ncbi:histone-lysine n-methyltransferase [Nannochloropsis oceanica]